MPLKKGQQIGIWIIAITLTVGTIGSFAGIVLAMNNQAGDEQRAQEEYARQLEEFQRQQAERAKQNAVLEGYSVSTFNGDDVTELAVRVLVEGDGAEVSSTDSISASYTGWLADGTIFDSTNKKDAGNSPVEFPLTGVIEGWTEGLSGQKVGSVVELTIPADKGYGAQGSGSVIPPNAALRFIVKIERIAEATV